MSPSAVKENSRNGTNQHLTDTAVAKVLSEANTALVSDNLAEQKSTEKSHAGLDASLLTVERRQNLQDMSKAAPTGCTDHMITCQWTLQKGWKAPKLVPFGPFSIMPNASVLHCESPAESCVPGCNLIHSAVLINNNRCYRMLRRHESLSRLRQ